MTVCPQPPSRPQRPQLSSPDAQTIQHLFNRIAPAYDRLNQLLSLGQHMVWKQMTVKWATPQPGDACLDVCCGSGDIARLLARHIQNQGLVIGLDFSPEQLAIARQRTDNRVQPLHITWLEGDALNMAFDNEQFDVVTMGYGLRNIVDIPQGLREIYRVLRAGGRAAILDMHRPYNDTIRSFQEWYLDAIVTPAADTLGLRQEYAYISSSLAKFPTGADQVRLAQQVGFSTATHYAIAGGMMGVLVITKA
ncbi:MAG: bifunctional demethylmenaquinone methyltransferase/2-methoxy-6-polyprenyl-1,4-benzoquinol methylase UbiE [Elainellaceae cyanobacterium]